MGKKILGVFAAALVAFGLVFTYRFAKKNGLLRKYPEAKYLSADEAARRPFYSSLNEKEKAVYEAIYRGADEQLEEVPLPYEIDGDTYSRLYCILEKQESRLFFLDSTYYTAYLVRDAQLVYRDSSTISAKRDDLAKAEEAALLELPSSGGDYEKVLAINDYIVKNCVYTLGTDEMYSSTAYGCLVEGRANCEGYAKTFSLLAEDIGLQSVLITGTTYTGENHAWNQVMVNGKWYNIDVTWADTDISDDSRMAYFLCSDEDFAGTHYPDGQYLTPFSCTSMEDNYYVRNGLLADSSEAAEEIFRREFVNGSRSIDLRFTSTDVMDSFKADFIENERIFTVIDEYGISFGSSEIRIDLRESTRDKCLFIGLSEG